MLSRVWELGSGRSARALIVGLSFAAGAAWLGASGCSGDGDASKAASNSSSGTKPMARTDYAPAPATRKAQVRDTYHGKQVSEDYRWLEDAANPEVQAWSDAQNAYARAYLDRIPFTDALRQRVMQIENAVGVEYNAIKPVVTDHGTIYFAAKSQPPKQQPLLVVLKNIEDLSKADERVIVDLNALDEHGGVSFDWFVPSPDGKYLAVSLSKGGSESGDVHVFDVASGKLLANDIVERVNGGTAGGSLAWLNDSSGFYCTKYPRKGERPDEDLNFYTQVYFHALRADTPSGPADRFEVGKDYPKIAEIVIEVAPEGFKAGNWTLTNVQNGDGGEFIQDLRSPDGVWTRLTNWDDRIVEAKFGPAGDDAVYLVSRKNAPNGKVLRLPLEAGKAPSLAAAKEVIAERSDASIETSFFERTGLYPAKGRLYVQYQVGGPNELRYYALNGEALGTVIKPDITTIEGVEVAHGSKASGDDLVFRIDSFITPPAWYIFSVGDGIAGSVMTKTALVTPEPPNMPRLVVEREFARSKDGTKVPVNIIRRADLKPTKSTPALVWGYGGYGVNETPGFSRRRLVWLEQGGLFAVANIRGGGEYGEKWHLQGNLTRKQNCFDDFYAACSHLVERGYTSPERLSIIGGSNGGLLMGAMITQHPDLCKAVVSSVGIYDMLRVELSPNGAFNITEFGTVKNPEQFRALLAYSPLHNVKDGTRYPAVLFMTGANDPRVDPMQSRKMTARLQAADPAGLFLLRTSSNTGHGMGTPLAERIEQTVDQYAFLFEQLGVKYKPMVGK